MIPTTATSPHRRPPARRAAAAVAVAGLLALGVSCSSSSDEAATSTSQASSQQERTATTEDRPTVPDLPSTSTTAKPKFRIKQQADCITYASFSIAYSGLSFATPEQQEQAIVKFQPLVERLKQQTPQFATDIDTINFIVSKASGGGDVTEDDQATLEQAFSGLDEWNTSTCLIPNE